MAAISSSGRQTARIRKHHRFNLEWRDVVFLPPGHRDWRRPDGTLDVSLFTRTIPQVLGHVQLETKARQQARRAGGGYHDDSHDAASLSDDRLFMAPTCPPRKVARSRLSV